MLSIVIPTKNEEKIISETLNKLKGLLIMPAEIIVTDAGSSDRTVEIARSLASKVTVFSGSGKQNIAQGRNAGAKIANGDFLVFMDADCYVLDPEKFFAMALKNFEDNPKLVALAGKLKVDPKEETFADKIVLYFFNLVIKFFNNVLKSGEAPGEFQMIKKSVFDKLGGYREDLVTREDGDMFHRLSKIGQTRIDSRLVVFHSGRRAHSIGWFKLLFVWTINSISFILFDKPISKEWKVIR